MARGRPVASSPFSSAYDSTAEDERTPLKKTVEDGALK